MSASSVGDVTSLTDGKSAQSTTGTTQIVSLSGGVSTMSSSGATTCYKKKTCEEGGYYSSVPTDQKCSSKKYNEYTCYTSCSYKTCSDYGYKSSQPSGQTCTPVTPRSGLTCYKDCKNNSFTITISKVFTRSCPTNFASGFNGISSCTIGGKSCATHENSTTISNVAYGTSFKWTPQSSYSNNEATASTSASFDTTITSNATFTATYNCDKESSTPSKCSDTGYYDGYSCSTWGSYPTSRDCSAGYSELATSTKCSPYVGKGVCKNSSESYSKCTGLGGDDAAACYGRCYEDCDVDSWRRCCQQCNGGSV